VIHWLTLDWWRYLLGKRSDYYDAPWWVVIPCRARGHAGPVWFSSGTEPNMHCKNCGDDIG
jgi:hypothetical protein